jgi:hypothetical protein
MASAPKQMVSLLTVTVGCSPITTSKVVGIAHCDGSLGVKLNVNVPAAVVLIEAGLHVPVIPLVDVPGNAGAVLF